MGYNAKNFVENGEKFVIGGTLELKNGAKLVGFPKMEAQENSSATTIADLRSDFNTLLAKLKTSGFMGRDA